MTSRTSIPKWLQFLLRLTVPAGLHQSVMGDLEEDLNKHHINGRFKSSLWCAWHILGISGHFLKDSIGSGTLRTDNHGTVARLTHGLGQDLNFALRSLRKSSSFTIIAIVALALGIAANSAIFSVVNAVLLRPLPYKEPERLVVISSSILPQIPRMAASGPEIIDFRQESNSFEEIAAVTWGQYNLTDGGEPEQLEARRVSGNFFRTMGVSALLGNLDLPDEESVERVVVLSNGLWQRRFAGNRNLIGKSILLDSQSYTVIGVLPSTFRLLQVDLSAPENIDIWVPQSGGYKRLDRGNHAYSVIARLKPGVTIGQAQADMSAVGDHLNDQYYSAFGRVDYRIKVASMHGEIVGRIRLGLLILLGAVALVLLIACVNVANLLLSKAVSREREIAIRTALGASRWRVVRQLMVESLVLALISGAVGLGLTFVGLRTLIVLAPRNTPRLDETSIDLRVLVFTIAVTFLTGLLFGLAPALQISKPDLNESLKDGSKGIMSGGRGHYLRKTLVVSEVALSLMLLMGAGLMIRSFLRLQDVNPGFDPNNVLTAELQLPSAKYSQSSRVNDFYQQFLERVGRLPGVQSAGIVSNLPLKSEDSSTVAIDGPRIGRGIGHFEASYHSVSSGYLEAMKIPLIAGRYFTEQDNADAPKTVIINEGCAKRFWPNQNPIGKRINMMSDFHANKPWATIVGIVGETKEAGLDTKDSVQVYLPAPQRPQRGMTVVIRTAGDPVQLSTALRETVWSIDRDQPVADIKTMDQRVYASVAQPRFNMLMFGVFAVLAITLASIGIYGVMNYAVSQRTREIGIRMALGAQRTDIFKLVMQQGFTLVLMGILVGLAGSFAVTRVMASLLFGITATDATTFILVPLLLFAVATLASYVPVRRATKVDPLTAIRYE